MKITKAQLRRIVRESYLPAAPPTSQLKPFVKKGNYLTPGFKNAQGDFMMIGMYTFYGENDVEWIVRNEDVELGLEALHRWKKPSQKIWAHTTHFEKPDLKNVVPRSTLERIIANDDAKRAGQPLNDIQKEIDQRWPFESDHDNLVKAGQNEINENTKAHIRTIIRRTIAETSLPRPKSRRRHRSEVQGFENINENMLSFGIATAGAAGSLAHAWDEGQRLASEREALPARWKKDYGLETDPYLKAANGDKRAAAADREDDEKWIRAWAMKSGLTFEKGKAPNELSDSSFKNLSNKQLYILMQRLRKPGIARRIKKMFGDNYVDPKEEYPAFGDF